MTVEKTLAELVKIDSVSSRSNAEMTEYLTNRCEALGLQVKHFPYTDENGIEKINLIAVAGTEFSGGTNVELALVGHTDTVPYDPEWKQALNLTEDEGKLYGRGACDTKAFIAAALTAVENLDQKNLRRPIALIFTADEEVGLMGAKKLADLSPLRAHYSIVGEPTSLRPIRAGKGYCLAEILVRGREGHSAYPAFGASAILRAGRLLSQIEKIGLELRADQHEAFDPAFTTLNIGLIHGGTAKNIIAGQCHFTLEWRPVPNQKPTRVLELLDRAIAEEIKADPDFECKVDLVRSDGGFETSVDSRLVTLMEEISGRSAATVSFGTEAPQMIRLGAESVVFGPGDIRVAHRTGEFVPISELNACVEMLSKAVKNLCQ